mmetsp:Transcript_1760/g.2427  ORF Transcript_1760/g.2427 Transcript_1760/m.2427 type:complete len:324 (+) Transcript_1760:277-1248(+)
MRISLFFYFLPSISTAFLINSPLGPTQLSAKASIHILRSATAVESDVDDELDVLFLSDDDEDDDDAIDENVNNRRRKLRWSKVAAKSRQKVESNVTKKHESKQDKKRRIMMFMKEAERKRKLAARVERKIPLDMRLPLSALKVGSTWTGTVISLTDFGAYVDIGTECDGLLHIGQISSTFFVEHPRQVFSPGEEVKVTIRSFNAELKKLHLTMLPLDADSDNEDEEGDRIPIEDIEIDDELWGELVRVTDYGAYVEIGADVKGFLHFMDHPMFGIEIGSHPSSYMEVGQRVRVWASDVNHERNRIQLTANRPTSLPGPRRELF